LLPGDWKPELIVNRLRPALVRKGKMLSVEDVDAILRLPLLGVIPDEPGIIIATNKGRPIALDPHSPVGAAYRQIAARLTGQDVPAPTVKVAEPGFFSKFGALFGGR
jgi:septum site-determining protein MinD